MDTPNSSIHPKVSDLKNSDQAPEFADPIRALDHFASTIGRTEFLSDDYGDWMRKVNAELNKLAPHLASAPDNVRARFALMKDFIQLEPDFRIMDTLRRAVRDAIRMREDLGAKDTKTLEDYGVSLNESDPPYVEH
ncbi:MAG: hypothetical protein EOP05_04770 [Proteobacteria bacterium]|nr:MAG: hypothetical protein EOP05_04770 [Pseudomonadota bacterium]